MENKDQGPHFRITRRQAGAAAGVVVGTVLVVSALKDLPAGTTGPVPLDEETRERINQLKSQRGGERLRRIVGAVGIDQSVMVVMGEAGITSADMLHGSLVAPRVKDGVIVTLFDEGERMGALVHLAPDNNVNQALGRMLEGMRLNGADISRIRANVVGGREGHSEALVLEALDVLKESGVSAVNEIDFLNPDNRGNINVVFDTGTGDISDYQGSIPLDKRRDWELITARFRGDKEVKFAEDPDSLSFEGETTQGSVLRRTINQYLGEITRNKDLKVLQEENREAQITKVLNWRKELCVITRLSTGLVKIRFNDEQTMRRFWFYAPPKLIYDPQRNAKDLWNGPIEFTFYPIMTPEEERDNNRKN